MSRIGAALLSLTMLGSAFAVLESLPGTAPEVSAASAVTAVSGTDYGLADTSQHGVILHCWNWSYNNIKKYMKDIAAAGYTSIQTSPVQQPKDYYWEGVAYGNVGIPNGTGGEDGNWWKLYQPVTFSICDNGYTWLGTKAEFKAMCAEAEKYGVKVIVDIVANHMGNIQGYKIGTKGASQAENEKAVMSDISPQVGQFWKADMLTDPSYWHISTSWTHSSDGRFDVTQGNMGMPDLNTGDSKVQQMVLNLLKECIDCGADGFRFDAAKHIETPADNASFRSDFWNVVLDGARAYYKQKNGYDGVYFYGEVLNRLDDTNAENYYLSKMSLTDNSTSDNLRNSVMNGSVSALATTGYNSYIHGKGDRAVLWPESHDTYMGGGSSYDANDTVIKQTWAIIASRKDSTGLFFARPYYSKDILAGDVSKARQSVAAIMANIDEQTQIGDVGTLTWADPAVVAANRFRNYFVGQSEKLGSSGNTAYNLRGKTGIVIVRGEGPGAVSLSVGMQDGTYYDQVTGEKFTVSGGTVKGTVKNKDGIAVVYNPSTDYGKVNPPEPTVIRLFAETANKTTSFMTDNTTVTMTASGCSSVSYKTSEGISGSFTGSTKSITIGNYTATNGTVTLTMTGTASDGTKKSKSFTYTKKIKSSEYPTLTKGGIVFDNTSYNWKDVYIYAYTESGSTVVSNANWPGEKMNQEMSNYWSYEYPSKLSGNIMVIFNNGSGAQYPGSGQPGLQVDSSKQKLFDGKTMKDLPKSVAALTVSLKPSTTKPGKGQAVTLKANTANANGTVKYTFMVNDGTVLQSAGTSNSCTWTPSKEGNYIVAVKAQDSSLSVTAASAITVLATSPLTASVSVSNKSISLGKAVTVKGSASGGTSPYQFAYYYKAPGASSWTAIKSYSTQTSVSFTAKQKGSYQLLVRAKDSKNATAESTVTLSVVDPLKNNSTVSPTTLVLGNKATVSCSAAGGSGGYKFAVFYRRNGASGWMKAQDFSTNKTVSIKPQAAVTYDVLVKVKDSGGRVTYKYLTLKVIKPLKATSILSASTIKLGSSVKVTAGATGGVTPYQFAVYYRRQGASGWMTAQSYGTNKTVTIKPQAAVKYDVLVKVKDARGKVMQTTKTLTVTK